MHKLNGILLAALVIAVMGISQAQAQREPSLPAPLKNLADEGAQMRYLGNRGGLDGWIAIKGGQEQYFYVTEDQQAFVMGLLFDKNGKAVTLDQVRDLQKQSGSDTLDLFTGDILPEKADSPLEQAKDAAKREFKTPAEQLFSDVEGANWVTLGDKNAPYIYTFIDPQCPHCHAFLEDLRKNYIDNGLLQVRILPVGFREDTRAQAAFLLAVPDPQKRWYAHLDGDDSALPVTPDINQQGVQRNLAIMQSWKVNVTPFTVYRTADGDVRIVQGRAQDPNQILSDLR
ncbi:MAG: thiol:disulfide interchange protein DsbG [Rhodospirillales bacterium]|nr:thiol:disulfide interchange protein DsbG [Rhodospirillales bacterium]MCB9996977.1 thiol:disulfide interchange protein DsbG [Rhodospirillales bacterium]